MYLPASNRAAGQRLPFGKKKRLPFGMPSPQLFPHFLPDRVRCGSCLGPPRTIFLVFSVALPLRGHSAHCITPGAPCTDVNESRTSALDYTCGSPLLFSREARLWSSFFFF